METGLKRKQNIPVLSTERLKELLMRHLKTLQAK
jgi:hypothetical protein